MEMEQQNIAAEETPKKKTQKKAVSEKPVITDDTMIFVKSNLYGKLYYVNLTTKEKISWRHNGDIQPMSFRNLRDMKMQQISYFKNNWIVIVGFEDKSINATPEEVYDKLGVVHFYKDYVSLSDFSKVCSWSVEEVEEKVSMMSRATRENLIIALNGYISSGRLDSLKLIRAFEKALDCEFTDYI